MSQTIDFDAFRAEQAKVPVKLRIGGVEYDLPSSLPAAVAVDMIHLKSRFGDDSDVPIEILDTFGRSIFGPDLWVTVLTTHRIEVNELGDLIQMVLAAYSPKEPADPPTAST